MTVKSDRRKSPKARKAKEFTFPCNLAQTKHQCLFGALSPQEIKGLAEITREVCYKRREPIIFEGDRADFFYEVCSGVLRISKNLADGRRQITGFLYPGDVLGFALAGAYIYGAEAIKPARLCRLPQGALRNLAERSPSLRTHLFTIASNELAMAQEHLLLVGRKSAREKVASFLTMLARRSLSANFERSVVELPMSRSDISDYLGLSIESVSRAFTSLQREGLIKIVPSRITLLQPDQLKQMAAGAKAA